MKMHVCSMLLKASKDSKDAHVELEGKTNESPSASGQPAQPDSEEVKKMKGFFKETAAKLKNAFKGMAKTLVIKGKCETNGQADDEAKTVSMDTGNDEKPVTMEGHISTPLPSAENLVVVDA